MITKIKSLARRYPKATYAAVFAVGGIATLSFGFLAKIFAPAAKAVTSVTSKVAPGA
jgi:hypothetical protein